MKQLVMCRPIFILALVVLLAGNGIVSTNAFLAFSHRSRPRPLLVPVRPLTSSSSTLAATTPNSELSTFSRRDALGKVFGSLSWIQIMVALPQLAIAMYENNAPPAATNTENQVTLPSGVMYQDLRPGTDQAVVQGNRVNVQWVLKRSNGYLVDSSERNDSVPFIFKVGDPNGAIAGVDEGIRGMCVGGIRRIIVPPNLSYVTGVEDGKPGPIPAGFGPKQRIRRVMELLKDIPGEFIVVDVKLTRVQ